MVNLKLKERRNNQIPNRWSTRELRNLDEIERMREDQFEDLTKSVDALKRISQEKEYILRSQVTFLFSLFDFILHELIKFG